MQLVIGHALPDKNINCLIITFIFFLNYLASRKSVVLLLVTGLRPTKNSLVPTRKRNKSGLPTECERAWSSPRPVGTFNVGNQAETLGDASVHTRIV